MRIALIGYGKMGKAIEDAALKRGHEITLKVDLDNFDKIGIADLQKAEVAFEFTQPEQAFDNVMKCFKAGIPVVSGTTGWNEKMKEAEKYCIENKNAFFYSSNYSIGVNLFFEINIHLARLMNLQHQYDEVFIHESHHSGKLDSPSGTAITIANQIINEIDRLKEWVNYKTDESVNLGKESDSELPIFSTREEEIPGTHMVKYFSNDDEIEIIHKALNRKGFAVGAILAGEWLKGKQGLFGMKDLLKL